MNRYIRQLIFAPIGSAGQKKLLNSKIAIIGCGALGSRVAEEMVRSGCGSVKIIDRDFIELSNLQRQVLFTEEDVKKNKPKAVAAAEKLRQINSEIEIIDIVDDVNYATINKYLDGVDLILDGTDNFEARMTVNDYSQKNNIPYIYAASVSSYGCIFNIIPDATACLRCIYPEIPPPGEVETCDTAGIISPLVGVIASFESAEAIKLLTGNISNLRKKLLFIDIWSNVINEFEIKLNHKCRCCQLKEYDYLTAQAGKKITSLCGRNAIQITPAVLGVEINMNKLKQTLSSVGEVKENKFFLKFKVDDYIMTIFKNSRVIIEGTTDEKIARSLYSRYIGE